MTDSIFVFFLSNVSPLHRLIDGATDTVPTPPTTTTTTTTSTTTSQPPPTTTTPTPWRPPKPKPTPTRKEDTSTPPKPLVKTGRPHRPLGKVTRTVVVKEPPGRTAGAEASRDVRLRDQYLPAYVSLFSILDRLVGLVVKASASRAEDAGFESRLREDYFAVESYQ